MNNESNEKSEREKAFAEAAEIIWRLSFMFMTGRVEQDSLIYSSALVFAHTLQAMSGEKIHEADKLKLSSEAILKDTQFPPIPTYEEVVSDAIRHVDKAIFGSVVDNKEKN